MQTLTRYIKDQLNGYPSRESRKAMPISSLKGVEISEDRRFLLEGDVPDQDQFIKTLKKYGLRRVGKGLNVGRKTIIGNI